MGIEKKHGMTQEHRGGRESEQLLCKGKKIRKQRERERARKEERMFWLAAKKPLHK